MGPPLGPDDQPTVFEPEQDRRPDIDAALDEMEPPTKNGYASEEWF
jgi:hypothetical protein